MGPHRQSSLVDPRDREIHNLRDELERLRSRLSQLSRLSRDITSSLDVTTVLQQVIDAACELTEARYGALAVFDDSGRVQELITHGVSPGERERIGNLPQGLGILGWLRDLQQPLRLADLTKHPRSAGFPPHHPPMKSFLGVPIRHGDEGLGNLYLTEKQQSREFTPEDEHILVMFAGQAAMAIRNARLHQSVLLNGKRLDTILASSPEGIIYIEAFSGHVQANRRAQEVLGSTFERATGLQVLGERCRASDGAPLAPDQHVAARALKGEVMAGEEYLVTRPDGSSQPILCSATPIIHSNGDILGAVVQFQDLTSVKEAQRRTEELLKERSRLLELAQEERQRLQALIDTSPIGVLVVDAASDQVALMNREAQRILELPDRPQNRLSWYEERIIRRRPDGSVYDPQDLPLNRALARGEKVQAEEIRFDLPDGRSIPTLVNATPLYSPEGRIMAVIATIQDITPLEQIEKLRSEFLGMVSHELKTPLTAIKGSAATALGSRQPVEPAEALELFEIIDGQADRLRDLIDNLLDMSRIEAGVLSVRPGATDLREIIREVSETFRRAGGVHEVQVHAPACLPPVHADKRRISQVLANLVNNASKFSPTTAPILVEVEPQEAQVTVHVKDQGMGIPPDKLRHLFKKFSQVHDDAKQRLSGSGLGLAISRGIVEAHGGRIWAASPGQGQGSTFSFTLPLAAQAVEIKAPDTTRRATQIGRVSRPGERTKVLAVDDEAQVIRFLKRALDEAGYQPITTINPAEVMSLIEREEPDLVLLDVMLPGTSGFDLLKRIREFSAVPVIFLTAQDRDEDKVRALRMGADDYITKPFSTSELLARIEAALRRRLLPDVMSGLSPYGLGDLAINFAERRVEIGGKAVSLSATEYKILYELASHAGRVLTHDQILKRVWGPEYSGETELVRSFIRNLRRKLGDDAQNPKYIYTEHQVGYRMPKPSA